MSPSSSNHDQTLIPPHGEKKVVLHSCCAPCCGGILTDMVTNGIEPILFFYNPNIHPKEEYERRKNEQIRLANTLGIPFVESEYAPETWLKKVKGFEHEPERGKRCTLCFDMRLERTALFTHEQNINVFTSTLGLSRWKDMDQVNACGIRAAARYPGMLYWTYNWRKKGGSQRAVEIAKHESMYRQEYCGCMYSMRNADSSLHGSQKS